MNLTRDMLLQELECKKELVKLPTGDVLVSEYSAVDHMKLCKLCATNDYEKEGTIKIDIDKFNAGKMVYCLLDPETKDRLFTEEDIPLLMKSSSKRATILLDKINEINGLNADLGNESGPIENNEISGD